MKQKNGLLGRLDVKAFTLIELLVVVLIIGILAAIALPQYQMAVWKSRLSTVKSLTKTIANAEELYYLANGKYTSDLAELAVSGPEPVSQTVTTSKGEYVYSWGKCRLVPNGNSWVECILYNQEAPLVSYHIKLDHSGFMASDRICMAFGSSNNTDNTLAQRICKHDTNRSSNGYCGLLDEDPYCFWYYRRK